MNYTMKPIPTPFGTDLFVSKTEAQWAKWMYEMGTHYEYQRQGFDLDGLWYQPDFYVPSWQMYVEIKPFDLALDRKAKEKLIRLSRISQHSTLLVQGRPGEANLVVVKPNGQFEKYDFIFQCSNCGGLYVAHNGSTSFDAQSMTKFGCGNDPYWAANLTVSLRAGHSVKRSRVVQNKRGGKFRCAVCRQPSKNYYDKVHTATVAALNYRFTPFTYKGTGQE